MSCYLPHAADLELFQELAHATQDGLEPDANGLRLDALVPVHLKSQAVVQHLLQRQIPVHGGGEPRAGGKRGGDNNAELARLREKVRKLEQGPRTTAASSGDNPFGGKAGKGKGQSKGGKKKQKRQSFIPMPAELQKFSPTLGGKRICYAFNLVSWGAARIPHRL